MILVDDDPVMRRLLKKEILNNFREGHFEVTSFSSVAELEASDCKRADIAVVDYDMGTHGHDHRNGIYAIDLIKRANPEVEVVLFTAEESTSLAVEAFAHGARDYVVKNAFMFHRLNVSLLQCLSVKEVKRKAARRERIGITAIIISLCLLLSLVIIINFFPGLFRL